MEDTKILEITSDEANSMISETSSKVLSTTVTPGNSWSNYAIPFTKAITLNKKSGENEF